MKTLTKTALLASVLLTSFAQAKPSNVDFLNTGKANPNLPFSQIVKAGNTLYMSGQIGINPATGKLAAGGFEGEAKQTLENIKRTLEQHNYSMSNIVKCTVMLTNINDFKAFNAIYTQYFSAPYPARSAFAVNALALDSLVEVECIGAV
ncbi:MULTISPECIES: RidA family protein [Pseudoalteromonas]|jgi:reactive intermediate/imine deaminase|uniref:Enamine deaminase RidA n=1 Tax=Pseudoalteromonas agarivorans TaxID=176102 RepID=A0ABR5VSS0_9GAMM|nr:MULTISPECIES: Rid family detoxifying hydrolase [Pseudoalteromonas]MAJ41800.1 enamine deaminase RidA [Pseudoalteromonadaceae bacterium]MDC9522277.1 Rid family detoxifying hydrolase [Pseudoalteromonas sp. Angola-31]MDY6889901.1 Rid family detoxifying hydrolase [Pseudomonadota bacterium]OUX81885.1 MAG: enamine deaminase RidA [Pseudoalteromonas sp. TMED43]KYL33117.1 enamine deaminase RidA [Pseudoalteromonas telluritireducens]|tara:strand:+ start:196 stop:642 length:447 start_codon:yes stop_codon:yes gene_type:complete